MGTPPFAYHKGPITHYTVEQVALSLQVRSETVIRWIKEGKLTAIKTDAGYRITDAQLATYIEERTTKVASL